MLFSDLISAVEPDPNATNEFDAQEVAHDIREQLSIFFSLELSEDSPIQIESSRNPLDLMRRVIGENEVRNFQDGRNYIVERVNRGEAGEYNNRTNQVQIRFIDLEALLSGGSLQNYQWNYPIVKWVYTPDTSDRVTRILTWVASGEFPENSTRPSATLGTQFMPNAFSASGYNDGARDSSDGSVVIEGEREMSFVRQFRGINKDTLIIDGTAIGTNQNTQPGPSFDFAGHTIDCLKIVMDYSAPLLTVFKSSGETPNTASYCTQKADPDFSYATVHTGFRS